ncbi:MAG: hypothetical protein JXR37_22965 [Kiritimatiellae bacterium]|nr:hypothetical protein [Kiritimatiellia bacterium]
MNNFRTWLRHWLSRHPLRPPPADVQAGFTADVMRRIRAEPLPSRAKAIARPARWRHVVWAAAAAASVLVLLFAGGRARQRAAVRTAEAGARHEMRLLIALDEDLAAPSGVDSGLGEDIVLAEQIVVTEQAAEVEAGLERLIQLFEALGEDPPEPDPDPDTDDDWLRELLLLDQLGRRS